MRRSEIHVGGEYLTRTVRRRGVRDNLGFRCVARGYVRVEAIVGDTAYVKWLMRDRGERRGRCLPHTLKPHQLLVEVLPT